MHPNGHEKWILYSTSDEDNTSELRALNLSPDDHIVSVTGSGCRTLSLLTQNPRSVVETDPRRDDQWGVAVGVADVGVGPFREQKSDPVELTLPGDDMDRCITFITAIIDDSQVDVADHRQRLVVVPLLERLEKGLALRTGRKALRRQGRGKYGEGNRQR